MLINSVSMVAINYGDGDAWLYVEYRHTIKMLSSDARNQLLIN